MLGSFLTDEDRRKISAVVLSSMSKGISLLSVDENRFKVIICNEGRTEEEVEYLAREFKVQLMLLAGSVIGRMPNFKLLYKSVSRDDYIRLQKEVVDKYNWMLQ